MTQSQIAAHRRLLARLEVRTIRGQTEHSDEPEDWKEYDRELSYSEMAYLYRVQ